MSKQAHSAKYAFFYMISLIALIFLAISVGSVIFQVINKYIVDVVRDYSGRFQPEAIKFAISAIFIAAPVYFISTWKINKALFSGELPNDSGLRRWLSYFILFISSIVILGYLIGILYSFLDGEVTLKFGLKSLTALFISGFVFNYYLYDVKREKVKEVKNIVIKSSFYIALILVIASLVTAFVLMEKPSVTRARKLDQETVRQLSMSTDAVRVYYNQEGSLPASLEILLNHDQIWSTLEDYTDRETGEMIQYSVISNFDYQICANFRLESQDEDSNYYEDVRWKHIGGENCFPQSVDPMTNEELQRMKEIQAQRVPKPVF